MGVAAPPAAPFPAAPRGDPAKPPGTPRPPPPRPGTGSPWRLRALPPSRRLRGEVPGGGRGPGPFAARGTGGAWGLRGGRGPATPRNRKSSEQTVRRKLRESFAVPRLLVNGLAVFLIELVRFLGETVVQVLVVGLLTAVGDHVLKPFLAATFNSLLQPLLLFLLKVLCGIRELTEPLIDILAGVCSQLAVLLRAVRLVEINLQPDRRTDLGGAGSG